MAVIRGNLSLLLTALACITSLCRAVKKCEYDKTSCGCMTDEGLIDLRPLSQSEPYSYEEKAKNERYYWDPCKEFTMGTIISGAVQVHVPSLYYDIGSHDNAGSTIDGNGVPIIYMNAKDGQRKSFFSCICSQDFSFTYIKEDPQTNYLFEIKSKYCCPNNSGGVVEASLSVGSILTIVFFTLLLCYFLFGTVFQVAVKKASGQERLPNSIFWTSLPGLIKGGFLFTFSRCSKSSNYDKI